MGVCVCVWGGGCCATVRDAQVNSGIGLFVLGSVAPICRNLVVTASSGIVRL